METTSSANDGTIRVVFGGDVMLGRLVKDAIRQFGPQYPLGPIAGLMWDADFTIINLECAITDSEKEWSGAPKAFYFGAPLQASISLADAGVDMVSLANNHILDYDIVGLRDTLHHLRRSGIAHAGAGESLSEACQPAIVDCKGIRFGLAAFCDHQEDFAAGSSRPGIAYVDLDDEPAAIAAFQKALHTLRAAAVDWPILSLHWGPNMVWRPSQGFQRLAHAAINMGWRILFGHSAHVFHAIEIVDGCPILYAAGDLVDDYAVDPGFRNDHQLLFEMLLTRTALKRIQLHPVFIENCQARFARGNAAVEIVQRMTTLCREMGTPVHHASGQTWIDGV